MSLMSTVGHQSYPSRLYFPAQYLQHEVIDIIAITNTVNWGTRTRCVYAPLWRKCVILCCTYKVLTTSHPEYLHNLISVQSTGRTRSSSTVTLARPSVSSSLQITNRSFRYASPYLWNQLPSSFRQPHSVHSPPGSPHPVHITSSQSPPSLSPSITPSVFHSRLKTYLFHQSFPP